MEADRKRACGLVRVSSEEQARGGYGLEFQEQDIRTFCDRGNLDLLRVFRDEGYSGATSERPGFQEMMTWAREKRFDVLVVWKLDRLFRDTKLTLQTVDELASLGIEFRSVQESFTHDSNGRFLITIFAAGAEKERKDIAMRMYAGRTASAKRGTYISGGGNPPYGHRYNSVAKRLEVEPEEARVVKRLFRWLVTERLSLYKIQQRLNERLIPTRFDRLHRAKPSGSRCWWNKRTIGRILSNEVYTGSFTFRKYRRPGRWHNEANLRPREDWITVPTPAIISKRTFSQAQEQLRLNAQNSPRRTQKLYLLAKLLTCGHDGWRMQANTRPPRQGRMQCPYYFCPARRSGIWAVRCPSRNITESRIAPPVWEKLSELLRDPKTVLRQLAEYQDRQGRPADMRQRRLALTKQRERAERRLERLVELYLDGAITKDRFQTERRRLKDTSEQAARDLAKLDATAPTIHSIADRTNQLEQLYARYQEKLTNTSPTVRREVLLTFVRKIVVQGEELEIEVTLPSADAFAGQHTHDLSRKVFSLFLRTKLIPVGEARRQPQPLH